MQTALFSFWFSSIWFAGVNQCKPGEAKETRDFIEVRTFQFPLEGKILPQTMTAVTGFWPAQGNKPRMPYSFDRPKKSVRRRLLASAPHHLASTAALGRR